MTQARINVETTVQTGAKELTADQEVELAGSFGQRVWFSAEPALGSVRRGSNRGWDVRAQYNGREVLGRAEAYYAAGHTELTRPMIFADGFSYGRSDVPGVFAHFNKPYNDAGDQLFEQLLAAGIDIVVLGFEERHTYIQANAAVATSCIRDVISVVGNTPLIVGGVSMGGIITRYALAQMESRGEDHQTETYLSYDSPHNGAWIPLILQQLAYFFEPDGESEEPTQAALIRSPAAQQLLWAWVPDAKYDGPVATASELRTTFVNELRDLGWFPARPRKLGVANGTGNGIGRELPPGEIVFDWRLGLPALPLASATARFQPGGTSQPIGGMNAGLAVRRSDTSDVHPLDGAPGGTLDSFGRIADDLKTEIPEAYRDSCFVPSVSALALDYDPIGWGTDLYQDLSEADSALDAYKYDDRNSAHSEVTAPLAEWIVAQLTR